MMRALSTLYIIRHGQASYAPGCTQEDYDNLSLRGIEQAKHLGAWLAAHRLDAVYVGPRRRQKGTAEHLLLAARDAGASVPEPTHRDDLDEYAVDHILHGVSDHFENVMVRWARGEHGPEADWAFARFAGRVRGALRDIMGREGRKRSVAVVTSAGPVGIAAQLALGISDERALRLSWVVANSSVTEIRWRTPDDLTLVTFNGTPHLADRNLVTYL
jgi:broad specificity phosphatase PhoE